MKQWRKIILCKKADKIARFSFECADIFLEKHHLSSFYDKRWTIYKKRSYSKGLKRKGVLKCLRQHLQ